jgi:uroporphyrinogen III methyltransferase / synthase
MTAAGGLAGRRVAVTRPAEEEDGLAPLLTAAGAAPLVLPLVAIAAPPDVHPLQAAVAALDSYDWVVFTSANAVRALTNAGGGATPVARVAAVGPATAQAVRDLLGWRVDVVPGRHMGGEIVAAMQAAGLGGGQRVLWPRAEAAREELPRDLRAAGANVDDPVAYRTVALHGNAQRLADEIRRGTVDAVILTSPSAADCLAAASPQLDRVVLCAIGPTTADAARRHGLSVQVQPAHHTIAALVDALREYYERPPDSNGPADAGGEQ